MLNRDLKAHYHFNDGIVKQSSLKIKSFTSLRKNMLFIECFTFSNQNTVVWLSFETRSRSCKAVCSWRLLATHCTYQTGLKAATVNRM